MKYFLNCYKHYADFKGRARRRELWYFSIFYGVICFLGVFMTSPVFRGHSPTFSLIRVILMLTLAAFILGSFIPVVAVQARRLHDIGRSGYWLFVYYGVNLVSYLLKGSMMEIVFLLVNVCVGIWFLVWYFMDSEYGPNKYGLNPKGEGNPNEELSSTTETEQSNYLS